MIQYKIPTYNWSEFDFDYCLDNTEGEPDQIYGWWVYNTIEELETMLEYLGEKTPRYFVIHSENHCHNNNN
jgi:hypothetical protein